MTRLVAAKPRIVLATVACAGIGAIVVSNSLSGIEAIRAGTALVTAEPNQEAAEDSPIIADEDDVLNQLLRERDPAATSRGEGLASTPDDNHWDIERKLLEFDGKSDHHSVAACLTDVRRLGKEAQCLQSTLLTLMSQRARLYDGRIKLEVIRLRAYVLLALVDTGNAKAAFPYVCEYVRTADDYGLAYEAGVGAYAASALGSAGRELLDDLTKLFYRDFSEPEFSLDRYSLDFPTEEATTVRLEIIEAFQRIGFQDNRRVAQLLQTCAAGGSSSFSRDSRIAEAASKVLLDDIIARVQEPNFSQPLNVPVNRTSKNLRGKLEINYVDQEGRHGLLADLVDRPTALVFFYTRCTNGQKCSTVVSRIAQLQQMLSDHGALEKVRLIGITFEPKSDDAARLKNYGLGRNLRFDDSTRFLCLDPKQHPSLISLLDVPVSYSDGWVNTHGVVLFVISESQHLVARYETVSWENKEILSAILSMVRNQ